MGMMSQGKGGPQTSSVQNTTLPAWEDSAWQNMYKQAGTQANADISTINTPQMVDQFQGSTNDILKQQVDPTKLSSGIMSAASPTWNTPGTAQSYMSPYEDTALKSQVTLDRNNILNPELAQSDEAAAASGALGGDRAEIAKTQLDNNFNNTEANTIAQGENTAYNAGETAFQTDTARQLAGATSGAQTQLAGLNSNVYANFAAGQNNLNEIQASEAPEQQLATEAGIMSAAPKQGTTQQDNYQNQGSALNGILGGVMQGAAAIFGLKKGGLVTKKRKAKKKSKGKK